MCGQPNDTGANAPPSTSANPGGAPAAAAPAAVASSAGEPQTEGDIFPPGPARDQVLNTCASCHNLACSAIGQRHHDRWVALKESHADKAGDADLEAIFAYLEANFGSSKPEPKVPARFLEGGCTPF